MLREIKTTLSKLIELSKDVIFFSAESRRTLETQPSAVFLRFLFTEDHARVAHRVGALPGHPTHRTPRRLPARASAAVILLLGARVFLKPPVQCLLALHRVRRLFGLALVLSLGLVGRNGLLGVLSVGLDVLGLGGRLGGGRSDFLVLGNVRHCSHYKTISKSKLVKFQSPVFFLQVHCKNGARNLRGSVAHTRDPHGEREGRVALRARQAGPGAESSCEEDGAGIAACAAPLVVWRRVEAVTFVVRVSD